MSSVRTSDRLGKIAEAVHAARADMRRLCLSLPDGATFEILESCEARAGKVIALLNEEAGKLRRGND